MTENREARETARHTSPCPSENLTSVQLAAKTLLSVDVGGGRSAVYEACKNRMKVYKFDAVLRHLLEGA